MSMDAYTAAVKPPESTTPATTPQSAPLAGREPAMTQNDAGGFVFKLDVWKRLDRFLILGTEGGTYYAREQAHTERSVAGLIEAVKLDGLRVVRTIVDVSTRGLAPSNDPALFALAVALKHGDLATKAAVQSSLPRVARIGTHLFHFAAALKALKASGPAARKALAGWYTARDPALLAFQLAKYQQRDGWSHKDVLALAHLRPQASGVAHYMLGLWARGHLDDVRHERPLTPEQRRGTKRLHRTEFTPADPASHGAFPGRLRESRLAALPHDARRIVEAVDEIRRLGPADVKRAVTLLAQHGLPREVVPTELLNSPEVWNALLRAGNGMPLGALVRNLGKMTSIGLLAPLSEAERYVAARLTDTEAVRRARLHPLNLLIALRTYARGHGDRGSLTWRTSGPVLAGLTHAYEGSYDAAPTTGKRFLYGLDVSGSMGALLGRYPMSCREAAGVLALAALRQEPATFVGGFTASRGRDGFTPLGARLNAQTAPLAVEDALAGMAFGGTDCALPILYALREKIEVDAFVTITDNETWAGEVHVSEALRRYRERMGIPAKLVAVGLTATDYSIVDPEDAGSLDVAGFTPAMPAVIASFVGAADAAAHEDDS